MVTAERIEKTTLKNLPFAKLELLKDLSLGTSHSNPNYNNFDIIWSINGNDNKDLNL